MTSLRSDEVAVSVQSAAGRARPRVALGARQVSVAPETPAFLLEGVDVAVLLAGAASGGQVTRLLAEHGVSVGVRHLLPPISLSHLVSTTPTSSRQGLACAGRVAEGGAPPKTRNRQHAS